MSERTKICASAGAPPLQSAPRTPTAAAGRRLALGRESFSGRQLERDTGQMLRGLGQRIAPFAASRVVHDDAPWR